MPSPYFSEIKFLGGASLDFIEVAVDPGTDVSGIQVVVYNTNGTVRSTNTLGTLVNTEAGRDIYVIDTATSGTFNGLNKNGAIALVEGGTVTSFLSFDASVTATAGPANGLTSTQLGGTGGGESLETSDNGSTYQVQSTPTPGNVPCFVTGTMILTARGYCPVENLRAGDKVQTADAGWQPVLWAGCRELSPAEHMDSSKLPVRIPAGSLAPGVPQVDLFVSPNHRMLLNHPMSELYFHAEEALAPAKALTGLRGIGTGLVSAPVRYHHILFDAHHVIWANGAATESLHLSCLSLNGFDASTQSRILDAAGHPDDHGPTARVVLKPQETRMLVKLAGKDDLASPSLAETRRAA